MTAESLWPQAFVIDTGRLTLEPLRVDHADELAPLLDDQRLHEYIGGRPATLAELRDRYARQVVGHSADRAQGWLNWTVRHRPHGAAVGTVQATLPGPDRADVAWLIALSWQGRGYATEAAAAMTAWLGQNGITTVSAYIHPDHLASQRVAAGIGLAPTAELLDGEVRWTGRPGSGPVGALR